MQIPRCRLLLTGEITAWGKQFLSQLEAESLAELAYEPSIERVCKDIALAANHSVVVVENSPGSRNTINMLKNGMGRYYVIWFGRNFTKEDLQFAIQSRVYLVWENCKAEDAQLIGSIRRLTKTLDHNMQFGQIIRALKAIILQAEDDTGAGPLINEMKTAITKLEKSGVDDEFTINSKEQTQGGESRIPFQQTQSFGDALATVHELERTGMLRIRGGEPGLEGKIEFLQGKIVSAVAREVRGLKAIYRMFLWDDLRFLFARREAHEAVVEDFVDISMRSVCNDGEEMRRRFQRIRHELPPNELALVLEPSSIHPRTSLSPSDFTTLASVIEFSKVSDILDYNPLPDIDIYESLISLKKNNLIRVAA